MSRYTHYGLPRPASAPLTPTEVEQAQHEYFTRVNGEQRDVIEQLTARILQEGVDCLSYDTWLATLRADNVQVSHLSAPAAAIWLNGVQACRIRWLENLWRDYVSPARVPPPACQPDL